MYDNLREDVHHMENATLTISLLRAMKTFIGERLREASFSTPSEYIRSLIRFDQERRSQETLARQGLQKSLTQDDEKARLNTAGLQRRGAKPKNGSDGNKSRPSKE